MVSTYTIVIELYVCMSIVNAFLGITQIAYEEGNPGESIRSPFTGYPIASDLAGNSNETVATVEDLTDNSTNPINGTGFEIPWVTDAIADFTATIDVILGFVGFFTGSYIIDLVNSMGFPGDFVYIVTVPLAIYVMYMVFVLITNRLGN